MSSSIDNKITSTSCDKEGDGSIEDKAAKQLALQIEDLSIVEKEDCHTDNNRITCAACGKEGDAVESMNICNKCKVAKYCNAACKKKHRHKHKANCNEIVKHAAELYDEALFKEPPPPEDCPICMLPLPLDMEEQSFKSCCGKTICQGCIYAMAMEEIRRGKKKEELGMCAFCRTPTHSSNEEGIERIRKLMDNGNEDAYHQLACYYTDGIRGVPQDRAKANELLLKAGELGCAEANSRLGYSYDTGAGVERNEKKAKHFYELAAMKGDVQARYNLGHMEIETSNYQRAMKHFMIAARAGHPGSLDLVKQGFTKGFVTKEEYESTLRAYHERQTETKSDMRAASIALREWSGDI